MSIDPAALKADFPIFSQTINGAPLAYLDSAASSQKPRVVMDEMNRIYETIYSNVHRGAHYLGEKTTEAYEDAREKVAKFIGAKSANEVIFTKNATEGLNIVAHSLGSLLDDGDAVVLTLMEHHANIVPWHILSESKNIEIRWVPIDADGKLNLKEMEKMVEGAKIVSFTALSNVLGTLNPIDQIVQMAKAQNAWTVIDACQYVPHHPTNVQDMGADFIAFSGHKMCGPTGIGVLWGREELLDQIPPFMGGGEMILNVTTEGFTLNKVPWKFEAGTPPIVEAVGLGAAVDYLTNLGMENIREHEVSLTAYGLRTLIENHGDVIKIYGPTEPAEKGGVISFNYADLHPHDVSQVLDQQGVCVRTGHHCAKPLMRDLGIGATVRASLYLYNDEGEIDQLSKALEKVRDFFKVE